MAHKEQRDYLDKVKKQFPDAFKNCKVLDVGSFNVNGNEEPWFDGCDFIGLDLLPGPGVDVACPANEYDAPDKTFDTIISCECWEHNPFYKESIENAIRMLYGLVQQLEDQFTALHLKMLLIELKVKPLKAIK